MVWPAVLMLDGPLTAAGYPPDETCKKQGKCHGMTFLMARCCVSCRSIGTGPKYKSLHLYFTKYNSINKNYKHNLGPGKRSQCNDWLGTGRFGHRITVGGGDFPHPYDWWWGSPSLLHNGYRVSFTRVKRPSRGVDYPRPSRDEVKESVEVCLYFRLWAFVTFCRANLTF